LPLAEASDIRSAPAPAGLLGRIATALRIAPEGLPYVAAVAVIASILFAFDWSRVGTSVVILAIGVGAFFRDPERNFMTPPDAILSAADGKVTEVSEGPLPGDQSGELFHRVSVFMSPLDVHVNRSPVNGEVVAIAHTRGEFRAAFRDDASEHNERNLITFTDAAGRRYAIMQIAGYLARRIVCRVRPHDAVVRGQRLGLIMFGSRVDHFLPVGYRVTVRTGDRVTGGMSVIGDLLQ
jgi:phosphatidylserine decarboxylase